MRLHNLREGYKILPAIDKEKYQQRNGLEGPFSTLSGKVVYYDPKEGSYYDPDTDMYMTYDEFQNYDKDYSGMKDERDEVEEGGLRPSFAKELRNKELNKDKGPAPTGKTTGPDDYDFLKYKNKKKKETSEAVLDEAPSEVHTVYINGKKWKSFYKKESADKAAATIAARGKKTEVKSEPAPTYKAPAPTKAPAPKPQDPKQKAAMDKALKSIEMSFGPERKAITDQVLAMIRTAAMLNNPNWAARAWGNVEEYGIKDKADLVRELQMMIADEQKVKDDDLDGHVYGPDSNIKQMRKALDSIS